MVSLRCTKEKHINFSELLHYLIVCSLKTAKETGIPGIANTKYSIQQLPGHKVFIIFVNVVTVISLSSLSIIKLLVLQMLLRLFGRNYFVI